MQYFTQRVNLIEPTAKDGLYKFRIVTCTPGGTVVWMSNHWLFGGGKITAPSSKSPMQRWYADFKHDQARENLIKALNRAIEKAQASLSQATNLGRDDIKRIWHAQEEIFLTMLPKEDDNG